MKLIKLTAFSLSFFAVVLSTVSCERSTEENKIQLFSKTGIVLSGAQEIPATTSAALGTMDVLFNRETRILSFTIKWSGLTGNPTGIGIHGLAPVGYPASTTAVQVFTITGLTAIGTYTGSLLVDGIVIKEPDVLNGLYYVNIKTTANPNGEIRGQIRFQ